MDVGGGAAAGSQEEVLVPGRFFCHARDSRSEKLTAASEVATKLPCEVPCSWEIAKRMDTISLPKGFERPRRETVPNGENSIRM